MNLNQKIDSKRSYDSKTFDKREMSQEDLNSKRIQNLSMIKMLNTVMYNQAKLQDKNYVESLQFGNFKHFTKIFKV